MQLRNLKPLNILMNKSIEHTLENFKDLAVFFLKSMRRGCCFRKIYSTPFLKTFDTENFIVGIFWFAQCPKEGFGYLKYSTLP